MATRKLRFPQWDDVRLSIITLVLKDPDVVLASLASLRDTIDSSIPYEVIVVCNGLSPADVTTLERFAIGARLVVCQENTGFSGGCNIGAKAARGSYLLFLNDDTIVEPGSVAALLRAADEEPSAGAVGSMMLFPDGSIQECGSIMWRDGTTMPIGRGMPSTSLRFAHRRKVDYCSACALLVRREVFEDVGAFDESYFPAYYEDTDLALKLRRAGWAMFVEPASRIRHLEGASTPNRFRSFLFKRNHARFIKKWGTELLRQPEARPTDPAAVERAIMLARGLPIRVLVCDDRLPVDDIGSGFRRMLELVGDLANPMFAITFALSETLEGDHGWFLRQGIEIVDEPLDQFLGRPGVVFDVVIMSRPHNYTKWELTVRTHQPSAILVYDVESLFHRRIYLQAKYADEPASRSELFAHAQQMEATEREIARGADRLVCIAEEEREYLEGVEGHAPIDLMRPVLRKVSFTQDRFHEREGIVFVAGWLAGSTSPNADGFIWFAREVWPTIRAAVPSARLRVTGSNPPSEVRAYFDEAIEGVGRVPDLHDVYRQARVVIAPIRYGAGVKNKTMEALQSGCPTVATTIGAEGLGLIDGDAMDITDDATEFSKRVIALLIDPVRWEQRRSSIEQLIAGWEADEPTTWQTVIERAISTEGIRSCARRRPRRATVS